MGGWSRTCLSARANLPPVHVCARFKVFAQWNAYPDHDSRESWEARCACIATLCCCAEHVRHRPPTEFGGKRKRTPLQNIAELTAGLLQHVDLDPSGARRMEPPRRAACAPPWGPPWGPPCGTLCVRVLSHEES